MIENSWTWASIIVALGDTGEVSEALSLAPSIVSGWKTRGIPGPRWAGVVRLAAAKSIPDLSLEVLADIAAREFAEARA